MRIAKGLMLIIASLGLLAACTPISGASPTAGGNGEPTQTAPSALPPTPYDAPVPPPKGALAAQAALADRLSLPLEQITISVIEEMDWSDSCLGLGGPAESCLAAITPGYRVTLLANGQEYVYRTDREGQAVRAETDASGTPGVGSGQPGGPVASVDLPKEILVAIAARLNVSPADVVIVEAEQVDWPDACLGVQKEGIACAQVIVPGYRIMAEVNGQTYEFRSDLTGGQLIQDEAKGIPTSGALEFERGTGEACQQLRIAAGQAWSSACGGTPQSVTLSPERWQEWGLMASSWTDFKADSQEGKVVFSGVGQQPAAPSEARSLATWAGLVLDEIEAGRDSAAAGLAFSWHREGGIAGFCDDLAVYTSGFIVASTCKGQPEVRGRARLSAGQLDQMYTWLEQYQRFEYEHTDPAVADAMTIRMTFAGTGSQKVPEQVRAKLEQLAGDLFTTAGRAK